MVFAAHGLFGTSCITALTVQSTLGVRDVHAVQAGVVAETLACLDDDTPPAGVKIGMLATADNVSAVCDYLERLRERDPRVPVVLDPVMRSSSGAALLDQAGVDLLQDRLLGLVDWVTPNTLELAVLSGREVAESSVVPEICREVQERIRVNTGRRVGLLAKGGHLEKPDDYIWLPSGEGTWIAGERVHTRSTHGTGCALSSAFLSGLVLGHDPAHAAALAKVYVAGALRNAEPIGKGAGPLKHLWQIAKVSDEG